MGAVAKADWFTADLDIDEDGPDPFSESVESLGKPIDLENREAVLSARLAESLRQMNNLYNMGVTCELMLRDDHSCLACPISQAANRDAGEVPLGMLCRVGRDSDRIVAALNVEMARRDGRLP